MKSVESIRYAPVMVPHAPIDVQSIHENIQDIQSVYSGMIHSILPINVVSITTRIPRS